MITFLSNWKNKNVVSHDNNPINPLLIHVILLITIIKPMLIHIILLITIIWRKVNKLHTKNPIFIQNIHIYIYINYALLNNFIFIFRLRERERIQDSGESSTISGQHTVVCLDQWISPFMSKVPTRQQQ